MRGFQSWTLRRGRASRPIVLCSITTAGIVAAWRCWASAACFSARSAGSGGITWRGCAGAAGWAADRGHRRAGTAARNPLHWIETSGAPCLASWQSAFAGANDDNVTAHPARPRHCRSGGAARRRIVEIEAPFNPEGGAYTASAGIIAARTIFPIIPTRILTMTVTIMAGEKRMARKVLHGAAGAEILPHRALYRLMTWLSPAYPVGAFSYSSGIEWAVEAADIVDVMTLYRWLEVTLTSGAGRATAFSSRMCIAP